MFRLHTLAVLSGRVFVAILFSLVSLSSLFFFLYSQQQRARFLFVFFLDELLSYSSEDKTINPVVYREASSRILVSNPETV